MGRCWVYQYIRQYFNILYCDYYDKIQRHYVSGDCWPYDMFCSLFFILFDLMIHAPIYSCTPACMLTCWHTPRCMPTHACSPTHPSTHPASPHAHPHMHAPCLVAGTHLPTPCLLALIHTCLPANLLSLLCMSNHLWICLGWGKGGTRQGQGVLAHVQWWTMELN